MTAPTITPPPATVHHPLTLRALAEGLSAALGHEHRTRLAQDLQAVTEQGPPALDTRFPAAGRTYGRTRLPGWAGWHIEDAVRTRLLAQLGLPATPLAQEVTRRYHDGDAAERRGVLHALPFLPLGPHAVHLTDDALRTNDTRLIAAALGPYAQAHLDQYRWRQAVLKCLFTNIPLAKVAGLHERRDAELARMAAGFAAERRAAGRTVPADLWLIATHDG
ncbi:EboA domain-containing protein [Streptomyces sp. ML-6]|uniref:EboA domain-containing protein n=1 Tax=Streptomyces sp. ML-6 TaxID=2982693 RepID=UPI0024C0D610|nr:EboA domain-containing protein [Streptomyces sp. ML-6]MDK0524951.1 EboA domain-containing protein [Streptomyces sp. ML-6]